MEKSIYPSTIGVPKLALVGVSGAGKSSLASKLLPQPISSAAKIVGTSSAQTTLIPTQFYINGDLFGNKPLLQLRITLRSFLDKDLCVDDDAVFAAIQYGITGFAKGSKSSGIPLSSLIAYIDSGKYAEDLRVNVNGAVRLEQLNSEVFQRACICAKSLLENFDTSEIDSSVSKTKSDSDKEHAKIIALRGLLRQRWDSARKQKDSSVYALLHEIKQDVWGMLERLLPEFAGECETDAFTFNMENKTDRETFTSLLDPYSPLSLIIEKFEVACGMGISFRKVFDQRKKNIWPDNNLPFRLVLTDTVGLTQDTQESDYDIAKRLRTALSSNCQGILLMLPAGLRDDNMRTIRRRFSSENEEGRQIKRNHIPVFLGIARADEEITPQVDADEDADIFKQEMYKIWDRLSDTKDQWKSRFHAEDARHLTNQPKKITAYLNDLRETDELLADQFDDSLGTLSTLDYLFEITAKLQKNLFHSEKPIFFEAVQPEKDGLHIHLNVVSRDSIEAMASFLVQASSQYYIEQWLHWNTAYAFRDSTYGGYKFVSHPVQNGRISIYIDGDVTKAAQSSHWTFPAFDPGQIELKGIDLSSPRSASLYEVLELDPSSADEADVKRGLRKLFIDNFTKKYAWRFWRAMDRTIRRLSYSDPGIKANVLSAFEQGRFEDDASKGVERMLSCYRSLYQNSGFANIIEDILNEELSKEFNSFFFPLY